MLPLARPRHCPECLIGTIRSARSFYCQWSNGKFITAPDFPAWVCDVCGWREYEREAVLDLQTLLDLNLPQSKSGVARPTHTRDEVSVQFDHSFRRQP
jgi:hypothetical protein